MKSLLALIVFPLMLLGYLIGFIYAALNVGFFAGNRRVMSLGEK